MTMIRESISLQQQLTAAKQNYSAYQQQLANLQTENENLKAENQALGVQKDQLTEDVLNEQGYSELALSLADTRRLAGLTDVEGAGVSITLSDSTITDTSDVNQTSLIHSQDVQYVVDMLKAAGAEAIAINGERIVCTSVIICTGPTIRINNSRYPVPFVITAVCDPDTAYSLLQNDAYIAYRKSNKCEISVSKKDDLVIPAFSNSSVVDTLYEALEVVS